MTPDDVFIFTQFGRYLHMRGRSFGTQRSYGYLLEQYARWLASQKLTWHGVTSNDIETFLEEYRESHSRTSTALFATCLRSFYRWARRKRLVPSNPTDEIEDIARDRPAPRAIDDKSIRTLLAALDTLTGTEGKRNRIIVRTFLFTGLRLSELAGLDRRDVDMDAKTIVVRHAKGGRQRIIAMPDVLHQDLVAWGLPESGPIWRCSRGRLTAAAISEMFRRVVQDELGNHDVTAHVLRHTHATKLRREGADLRGIQTQLGHSKPETTAIYTAVYDEELHEAVNRLTGAW
jgi:site-specific recombinase XerD